MKYSTALVHDLEECPDSMNDPKLDQQTIQTLIKENNDAIFQLREREKSGVLPPLIIKHDPN